MHAHTSQLPAHVCGAFKPVFGGNVCRVCVYVVYFVYFVYVVNFRNVGTHLNIFTDIVLGLLVAPSDFLLVFAVTHSMLSNYMLSYSFVGRFYHLVGCCLHASLVQPAASGCC